MYEVEVKVPADLSQVRERVAALEATPLGTVEQADTYFEHPARDFAETDEALRLRRESTDGGPAALLTYKGPLVDDVSKTREEVETAVADPEAVTGILRAVGFEPVAEVGKTRERFDLEGYTVSLDAVEGIGTFVEVEAAGAADDVESLRDGAFELLVALGLDPDDSIRTSYLGMALAGKEADG